MGGLLIKPGPHLTVCGSHRRPHWLNSGRFEWFKPGKILGSRQTPGLSSKSLHVLRPSSPARTANNAQPRTPRQEVNVTGVPWRSCQPRRRAHVHVSCTSCARELPAKPTRHLPWQPTCQAGPERRWSRGGVRDEGRSRCSSNPAAACWQRRRGEPLD